MARRKKELNPYKFAVVVVTAGTVMTVGLGPRLLDRPSPKGGPVTSTAIKGGGGGDLLFNVPLLLIAIDGTLELYDAPNGQLRAILEDQGVIAMITGARRSGGEIWYELRLEDSSSAWVRGIGVETVTGPLFFGFTFCTGDAAAPSNQCGTILPLSDKGLWVQWGFDGLHRDHTVQWLLAVNGQQYTSGATPWSGPEQGSTLVNLLTLNPRLERGLWTVKLYVNGEFITESSVYIQ